ncbi:interferon-induced protein with tetratricopeptide repeats 5-like [Mixophyes fleayi]|uniref:interferon-induced protein with tetratricopeptide repeats 5-like n=1 Tax=Mixophyes fleayi TaxID=3061075 RepID=UPI003F4D973A
MSDILKNSLKSRLLKIQCHFTWNLLEEEVDIGIMEIKLYDQIQFLNPERKYRLYNLLAYTNHLRGDYEEAIAYLQKAEEQIQEIQSDTTDARRAIIYGNYAWMFYHMNHFIKGYTYVKKAQETCKNLESSQRQNILLFEIYSEQGFSLLAFNGRHSERAKDCFQRALGLDPENPELNSSYAIAVFRLEGYNCLKKPLDESFLLLKRAAELNPQDTVIKVLLGLKYQDFNNSKEGLLLIEEALRATPEFPYLLRYVAKFYRRAGMTDEAIIVLNEAVRLNPTSSHLNHQLALCYKKKILALKDSARKAKLQFQSTRTYTQEIIEAVSCATVHLEKAVEYKKTFVIAYIALASMYGRANQYEKAEEIYHKVLHMDNVTQEQKQELHLNWANHELYRRNWEPEAIRHCKAVIKIKCPTVFRGYAIKQCKILAEEMISKNPSDNTGNDLLDFIHQHDEKNIAETDNYYQALQLEPDNEE